MPEDKIELSSQSREQIREYAYTKAGEDLKVLQDLAATNPDADVPEELLFLEDLAKDNYKLADKELPTSWTASLILAGFLNREDALKSIETYYREDLLGVKEMNEKILQLGLDLSGGMSVLPPG